MEIFDVMNESTCSLVRGNHCLHRYILIFLTVCGTEKQRVGHSVNSAMVVVIWSSIPCMASDTAVFGSELQ